MADRSEEFFALSAQGRKDFPPVPPPLWETLRQELSPHVQQSRQQLLLDQQQGDGKGLSFRFLTLACSCHEELRRVQQQLHRRRPVSSQAPSRDGPSSGLREGASLKADADSAQHGGDDRVSSSAASVAAEVSRLLQRVRQQQQEANELEALAEDFDDLQALQFLRRPEQTGMDMRDTRAHRHAILRFLYTEMHDVTGELQRREVAALKQQMECSRYFSAVASTPPGGSSRSLGLTAGAAAAEAAAAAETVMRLKQQAVSKKAGVASRYAATADEDEHKAQEQDTDSALLLADERQLVATLSADSVDTVVAIQRKLQEIVQVMNIFAFKVAEQAEVCYEIGSLADSALSNVEGAEKQLATALTRHSKFRVYLVYAFLTMGVFVLFMDFLKSSSPYLI